MQTRSCSGLCRIDYKRCTLRPEIAAFELGSSTHPPGARLARSRTALTQFASHGQRQVGKINTALI